MTESNTIINENSKNEFSQFLLDEYDHISSAHFEMTKQIANFIRYYLLIISAPAVIFTIIGKDTDVKSFEKILNISDNTLRNIIAYFFLAISIIGFLTSLYVISLKHTEILYARVVNGVRNYFYSKTEAENDIYRVLPKDVNSPGFFGVQFLAIILIFAIANTTYCYLFLFFTNNVHVSFILISIIVHVGFYSGLSWYNNKKANGKIKH